VPFLFPEPMEAVVPIAHRITHQANCRACPRLAGFLDAVGTEYPGYFCKPVPAFGPVKPKLLIVGLAPGLHGANRTGRPFTGDAAGDLLFRTLHVFGYADRRISAGARDGLKLTNCRITNAVKCLPPQNKPAASEIRTCNRFLSAELARTSRRTAILALGGMAHGAVLLAAGLKLAGHKFGHGATHQLENGNVLFDSYHCSRYNTNTLRLTEAMFHDVFAAISAYLKS
jgi:uracil-DNA glycosylase family 4